jgi:cytochrome P450
MFWNSEVRQAQRSVPKFLSFAHDIINSYRTSPKDEGKDSCCMAQILKNKGYATDKERAADVLGFLLAGHDTTAYTLAWAVIEITRHPRVLAKLQNELDLALPNDKDRFTPDILTGMTYLHQVIHEVMRLQPVVGGGIGRKV